MTCRRCPGPVMITMREINMDIGSPGAEEANSAVHFCIAILLSSTGGSFLRRAGDENFSEFSKSFGKVRSRFPTLASLNKIFFPDILINIVDYH